VEADAFVSALLLFAVVEASFFSRSFASSAFLAAL
jgi:hypothetical protein